MRRSLDALTVFLLVAAPSVRAQEGAEQLLKTVRTLRCEFPTGAIVNLAATPPSREEAAGPTVVYDALDREHGRARVIGTVGAGDLQLIVGWNTLTLIEMTPAGTPMVTIVYGQYEAGTDALLAVQSRHFGHSGPTSPVITVGQYYGTCRKFE